MALSAIEHVREIIERELRGVLVDVERLRGALAALDGTPPASDPRPRGRPARSRPRRRAARGSVRQAVVEALAAGGARTAGEIAAGAGLNPATVSSILTRMADEGAVQKATRGYEMPAPSAPPEGELGEDAILHDMRAELRAGLRTTAGE